MIDNRPLVSGIIRTLHFPVTEDQIEAWERGQSIQEAMPTLSKTQRQFIVTEAIDIKYDMLYKDYTDDGLDIFSD